MLKANDSASEKPEPHKITEHSEEPSFKDHAAKKLEADAIVNTFIPTKTTTPTPPRAIESLEKTLRDNPKQSDEYHELIQRHQHETPEPKPEQKEEPKDDDLSNDLHE